MVKEIQRENIKIDLNNLRDALLDNAWNREGFREDSENSAYTDGVLDMYNSFLRSLKMRQQDQKVPDMDMSYL